MVSKGCNDYIDKCINKKQETKTHKGWKEKEKGNTSSTSSRKCSPNFRVWGIFSMLLSEEEGVAILLACLVPWFDRARGERRGIRKEKSIKNKTHTQNTYTHTREYSGAVKRHQRDKQFREGTHARSSFLLPPSLNFSTGDFLIFGKRRPRRNNGGWAAYYYLRLYA